MTDHTTALHSEKVRIVRELFIATADDNYITARWCFIERLNVDYFWLAVHALEKYMKAALLLNGRSGKSYLDKDSKSKRFGHEVTVLYRHVESFASDLLPDDLVQPAELAIDHWRNETPAGFLRRLYRYGNPDNRYQIFGLVRHREDLLKLDLMIFALRRLCVPLDKYFLGARRPDRENLTHRDILAEQPKWWTVSPTCRLERTAEGRRGEQLREVLLNLNVSFAPEDWVHGTLRSAMAWQNPVLGRTILRPLERASGRDRAALALALCDWVLENIQLPRDVETQLGDAAKRERKMRRSRK